MERHEQVLALRREGLSYRAIAAETGMDASNAAKLVKQHLENIPEQAAEEMRQFENERLTALALATIDQAFEFVPEVDEKGKPIWEAICSQNGFPILNQDGTPMMRIKRNYDTNNQAKAILLKIHAERVKLFGLAIPVKQLTEFSNVGAPESITFRVIDARDGAMVETIGSAADGSIAATQEDQNVSQP
jgi:hypothetical protein